MSLLLDALKKAAEQKAEKSREDIPAASVSDETEIDAATDISALEAMDSSLSQPHRKLEDETELDDSELQTRLESTRLEREDGDETGLEIPDATETQAAALSAQMQTGEDETIIFAEEDVSDFLGEPELVKREPQDETDLSQMARRDDQTDVSQAAMQAEVVDAPKGGDDTDINQPLAPEDQTGFTEQISAEDETGLTEQTVAEDQTGLTQKISYEDQTDISHPVFKADNIAPAVPGEEVLGDDTDVRLRDFESEADTDDEDLSLLLVEREDTNLTGRTSITEPREPPDPEQVIAVEQDAADELGLVDTTQHQLPSEATETQPASQTSITAAGMDTQTQGTVTRTDSTSTRTYAPDNYDRTLIKLPSDDASQIFAGMKSDSDIVMTPDYAKKVFRSKSSAQRIQHYKVYSGIAIVILLTISIFGAFEFQDESNSIDVSLRPLKRDPMPGLINLGGQEQETSLFNQADTGVDTRTIEIIESADIAESAETTGEIAAQDEIAVESTAIEESVISTEPETVSAELEAQVDSGSQIQTQPEQSAGYEIASAVEPEAAAVEVEDSPSNLQITLGQQVGQTDIWLSEAYAAYQSGDDELALARYNQVLEVDPGNRNALLARAAINVQNDNSDAAIRDYQALLLANPKDSLAMTSLLTVTSYAPGDIESQLKLMMRDEPYSPHLNFALANTYGAQERWREAQGYYHRALENNPNDPNYAYNLAVSLEHISQPRSAISYYQRALKNYDNGLATFSKDVVDQRLELLGKL